MLKIDFDFSKLNANIDRLGEVVQECIRPAAAAGAKVYYDEMVVKAGQAERGTGNLQRSIYRAYATHHSTPEKAVYHITWRKSLDVFKTGMPNARSYGHLIEYGFFQRYKMGRNEYGQFTGPLVREGMKGKRKPNRRDSQSVKDAYWQTLPSPIWHPPRSFLRATYDAKSNDALEAANKEMQERLLKAFA